MRPVSWKRHRIAAGVVVAATILALVAACSSATTSGGSSTPASSAAASSAASSGASGGFMDAANALIKKLSDPATTFSGPTTGPKTSPGKTIILITLLGVESGPTFAAFLKAVCAKVGWNLKVIDQGFDLSKWTTILDQAIALKPDGIIATMDPSTIAPQLDEMKSQKITFLDYDNAEKPGVDTRYPEMFSAINSPAAEMAQAKAAWGIVQSDGKARWINAGSTAAGIVGVKTTAAEAYWKTCTTCTELTNYATGDSTLQQVASASALMTSWISKYGTTPPIYVSVFSDVAITNLVPALTSANVAPTGVVMMGDGGYPDAYQRIRNGTYQTMTLAEPLDEYAYWTVDEFNRSFNNVPADGYAPQPLLVNKQNIDQYGGDKNAYTPPYAYAAAYEKIWGVTG